jgi:hypothetical protein
MNDLEKKLTRNGRREFLSMISSIAAIGLLDITGIRGAIPAHQLENSGQQGSPMPTISLGKHRISRLICGANPMLGYSYMGSHCDRHMKEYFTPERTVEFLLKCEQAGITAHQMSHRIDYIRLLRERGTNMKIFRLHEDREKIKEALELDQPIALVHHGGTSDRLFAEGKSGIVHDYVKAVKDKGLMAGVSAHNPDVIKQIADEDWEVDFFMTCFYFLSSKLTGEEPSSILPVGSYNFVKDDPLVMTKVIRQVKQPCLAFKILGAGRQCANQEMVRSAFKFAFENIKPTDGVIVGMFPWFFDEIITNTQYTRELGKINGN